MSVQRDNAWRERVSRELRASHGSQVLSKLSFGSPRARHSSSPSPRHRTRGGWASPSSTASSEVFSCHKCGSPNQIYSSPGKYKKASNPRPVHRAGHHHRHLDIDVHSATSTGSPSPRPTHRPGKPRESSPERRVLQSDIERLNISLETERLHRQQLTKLVKDLSRREARRDAHSDRKRGSTSPMYLITPPASESKYRTSGSDGRRRTLPISSLPAASTLGGYVGRSFTGRSKMLNPTRDNISSDWQGELRSPEKPKLRNRFSSN